MVGLSDDELAIVTSLAQPLHPDRRSAFLAAVVEEAGKHGEVGPGLVSRIARPLQKNYFFRTGCRRPPAPRGNTSGGDMRAAGIAPLRSAPGDGERID